MKKAIVTLTMTLIICVLFALPALAADGSSFDTAIPITPGTRSDSETADIKLQSVTHEIFYVFTAEEAGVYKFWETNLSVFLYNNERNRIANLVNEFRLEAGETYYLRVHSMWKENTPHRFDSSTTDYSVASLSITYEPNIVTFNEAWHFITNYWWTLLIVIAYVFLMNFSPAGAQVDCGAQGIKNLSPFECVIFERDVI